MMSLGKSQHKDNQMVNSTKADKGVSHFHQVKVSFSSSIEIWTSRQQLLYTLEMSYVTNVKARLFCCL